MCRIDDAERCEFNSAATFKARKTHKCGECYRTIEPGETYERAIGVMQGDFFTYKTCAHCVAARGWLVRECRGYIYSQVEEELREHWREDGIHTRELARLIWGMRRKWTRRNGTRMELPHVEKAVAS